MSTSTEEIADLLRQVVGAQAFDSRLWDTSDVAAFLGVQSEYVRRKLEFRAGFPTPLRVPSRRWRGADIKAWRLKNPGPVHPSGDPMVSFLRGAVRQAKKRATKHAREIDLNSESMVAMLATQRSKCAVSGVAFSLVQMGGSQVRPFAPSIDRIESSKGYVTGNIRLVCHCVNLMMNEWGDSVFHELVKRIRVES